MNTKFAGIRKICIVVIVGLFSVIFWFATFGGKNSTGWAKPLAQPVVQVVTPGFNEVAVPLTSSVVIGYDQDIDPTTVTSRTVVVHGMQSGLLSQNYSVQQGEITASSIQPYKPGELIEVSATTGTLTLDGQGPVAPTVWSFLAATASGSAFFSETAQSLGDKNSLDVSLVDVDGDGDLDAYVQNTRSNEIWINDGSGFFTYTGQSIGSQSLTIRFGDLDVDGDLDAFAIRHGTIGMGTQQVWFNDGSGLFSLGTYQASMFDTTNLSLGDLDGDGDLDTFFGGIGTKVWLNLGMGVFTDTGQSLGGMAVNAVALGDLDNDGDLDAFLGSPNRRDSTVWFNDGKASFTPDSQKLGPFEKVALGDLDGDGNLDSITGNGNAIKILINDGSGHFIDIGETLTITENLDFVLGDLDGDGDLDLFFGCGGFSTGIPDRVWLNDGTGYFYDTGQILGNQVTRSVALGDLDSDGNLDAFAVHGVLVDTNGAGVPNKVWLNQTPVKQVSLVGPSVTSVEISTTYTATITPVSSETPITYTWLATGHLPLIEVGGLTNSQTFSWPLQGEKTIRVTATNAGGTVLGVMKTVVYVPVSGLTASNSSPTRLGDTTVFTATVTSGNDVSYYWDFGDGTFGNGAVITHTYSMVDFYTAVITATNPVSELTNQTIVEIIHPGFEVLLPIIKH